jgi:hypothetical protein
MILQPHTSVLFLLTRVQTYVTAVGENKRNLRRACEPPVHIVDENDIPRQQRGDKCGIPFENIRAEVGVTTLRYTALQLVSERILLAE